MIDQSWLEICASAGELLYGYYPVYVLKKLYESRKRSYVTVRELKAAMDESTGILMDYHEGTFPGMPRYKDGYYAPFEAEDTDLEYLFRNLEEKGNPYAALHLDPDEREYLLNEQGSLDFYIPSESEIRELIEHGYIRTKQMTEAERYIESKGKDPEPLKNLWRDISTDEVDVMDGIQEFIGMVFDMESAEGSTPAPSMDELNEATHVFIEFCNHVHMRSRRGWQPAELSRQMKRGRGTPVLVPGSARMERMLRESEQDFRDMGVLTDYSGMKTIPVSGIYGERRNTRVGPNDLCPCGSGKKFRKCHGRG